MKKTKKVLSLVCALAMIFSMLSAFTIVKADTTPELVVEVTEDTTREQDNGSATITFRLKGVTETTSVFFNVPLPTAITGAEVAVNGDVLKGGTDNTNYNSSTNNICVSYVSTTPLAVDNAVIATATIKNATKLADAISLAIKDIEIVLGDGISSLYDGDITVPSSIVVGMSKNGIFSTAKYVAGTPNKVVVTFTAKNVGKVTSIFFNIPLDALFESAEVAVNGDVLKGGTDNTNYNSSTNNICVSYVSTTPLEVDGKDIATATLVLKDSLTEVKNLTVEGTEIVLEDGITSWYDEDVSPDTLKVVIDPTGTSSGTTYAVEVADDITNGTVTVDKTTAAAGDKVTVTATPADGYVLDAITVKGADGSDVTVATDNTFTMPAQDVTVSATFSQASTDGYKFTVSASNATVTVVDAAGNTVKSGDKVAAGTVLTATVEANSNYTVSAVKFNNQTVTANDDGTYTLTMPAKIATLTVTTAKNSSYEFAATADKETGTKIGTKYEVSFTENPSFTGTPHENFDVVVQVYNSSNVAAGYMIFKDVTTADTVTFYIPKNSTASVNFVDELDDSSSTFGDVIAQKVSK